MSACICRPLGDDDGLEILTLCHLLLDVGDDFGQVRDILDAGLAWSALGEMLDQAYIFGLGPLALGEELVGHGALVELAGCRSGSGWFSVMYLESAADAEDAVVGLLGRQALEGVLDGDVLLGQDVIGPVGHSGSAHGSEATREGSRANWAVGEASVPQAELPVASGVAVPLGERLHPLGQPRALEDVGGEGRRRHGFGGAIRGRWEVQLGVAVGRCAVWW